MERILNAARARIARSRAHDDECRTVLVSEGADAPNFDRLRRRGFIRFGVTMALLYAAIALVPDPFEVFAALAVTPLLVTIYRGAFRESAAAAEYFAGWVDGRMGLYVRLADELPNGPEAVVDALQLENQRDLEVVLDVRTTQAPDDLSDLESR